MAVVREFYVELFVADRAPYKTFLERAFCAVRSDPTDTASMFEAPGLRVLLHEGKSDLPERHFFREPIDSGARKGVGGGNYLGVDDLEAVQAVVADIPSFNASPIRLMPWGLKDFRLTTRDNYYFGITALRPV
jgi:hypothetical protein